MQTFLFRLGGVAVLGRSFFWGRHPHNCDNKQNKELFFLFVHHYSCQYASGICPEFSC